MNGKVAKAQTMLEVHGTFNDPASHPIEFAEVGLFKNDTIPVVIGITDSAGKFKLHAPSGNYTLKLRQFDVILFRKVIDLSKEINLGVIPVPITRELSEVKVTGKKNLMERKIDRLVFNVENSMASQGTDMIGVLKNVPLVKVDNTSISLIGKSALMVMVNDRILNIQGEDLINYLKTLRSEDISKVEIITSPPAKYDAAGNSGLINIILKKNSKVGFSGTVASSYTQRTYPGVLNSASLNFLSTKLAASVKIRQFDRSQKASENINLIGDSSVFTGTERKDKNYGAGANLSFDLKLTEKSNIGVIYDVVKNNSRLNIHGIATYVTQDVIDSILTTPSQQIIDTWSHTVNLFYDLKIDTSGKKLSLGANYFSNSPGKETNFQTLSSTNPEPQIVRNTSKMNYSISSAQADFTIPLHVALIQLGGKYTKLINESDVKYLNFYGSSGFIIDQQRSNEFDYNEDNVAGYISAEKTFSKKWSAQAGLRYEYSNIKGFLPTTGQVNRYNYGKLFPTVYVQYKAGENSIFNVSYSKRIDRPGFSALNPFQWYTNPYIYLTGNPFLQPSFNHNIELNYLYKSMFNVSLYGQKTENGFAGVTRFEQGIKALTFENYLTLYHAGATASATWNPVRWWENYTSIIGYYSKSNASIAEISTIAGLSASYSINNTFTLDKKKSLYALLNFYQNLPSREVNVFVRSTSNLSSGIKWTTFEGKLSLNATVEDIFKGTVSKGEAYFTGFTQYSNNYYDSRRLAISASYKFGGKNVKGVNKQIDFSEKSRAN
jgi:hypothetical protein